MDYIRKTKKLLNVFSVPTTRSGIVVIGMMSLDALWWTLIYTGLVPMPGMTWLIDRGIPLIAPGAMELAVVHIGTPSSVIGYIGMWGVMMIAMMFPAMTRFTRKYAAAHVGSTASVSTAVLMFLASYSSVWASSGFIPLIVHHVLPGGIYGITYSHTYIVISGCLVVTGLYQLSAFKQSRLQKCCLNISHHDDGILDAVRRGVIHGVDCILVSFGLFFILMPFFGTMNFVWMIALTIVVTIERIPVTWGRELAVGTGIVAVIAGLLVLSLQPPLPVVFVT